MPFSSTPVLLTIELLFLASAIRRAQRDPSLDLGTAWWLLGWIVAYAITTSALGAAGAFVSASLLPTAPGLWLQVVTVVACAGPVFASPRLRQALRHVVDATPMAHWAALHALRISAVGTLWGAADGSFPTHFAWLVGVPDLAYGLSAFWIVYRAHKGALGASGFFAWNLLGAAIIVPAAPILLQLGLPGPFQLFPGPPDTRAVFTFPMSIAPMIGVPLFVLTNICVAWRWWERLRWSGSQPQPPAGARSLASQRSPAAPSRTAPDIDMNQGER